MIDACEHLINDNEKEEDKNKENEDANEGKKNHYCYILRNNYEPHKNRTYNGYTVNPNRRIRQHNQEIKGGAKYTKKWGNKSWEIYALLKGFPDHINALQCEWRIKHPTKKRIRSNKYNSPSGRITGLNEILQVDRWTLQSTIDIKDTKLQLWIVNEYAHLLNDVPANVEIIHVDKIDLNQV
jgi:predicted GIY-YIG superfamily endonuclease